jgi:hypothetical protein
MRGMSIRWLASLPCLVIFITVGCTTMYSKKAYMPPDAVMSMVTDASPAQAADDTKVAEDGNVEQTTNATDRLIMYDATLHVVVTDAGAALSAIRTMAANLGGYMQSLTGNAIVLRIPGPRLNEAIGQVERMGELTLRQITGTDVTEEMLDLDIRLKNMEETRARLVKLLDRAVKVEELLAVEKELQRVTESLEVMKGRIKYLSHAVKFSTLTVHVNAPVPQAELQDVMPFPWVRQLASEILLRQDVSYTPDQRFRRWLKMDLPSNCVKVHEEKGYTRIMSGSGVMLLIRRESNFEGGSLEFWAPLVRRSLAAEKALALDNTEDVTLASGAHGLKFAGTKTLGRKTYRYMLWLVATEEDIYCFECWGVADEVAKMQPQLDKAAKSMGIRP